MLCRRNILYHPIYIIQCTHTSSSSSNKYHLVYTYSSSSSSSSLSSTTPTDSICLVKARNQLKYSLLQLSAPKGALIAIHTPLRQFQDYLEKKWRHLWQNFRATLGPHSDYLVGSILPFQTTQVFSSYFGKITQLSGLLFVLALPLGTPGGQNREK